MKIHHSEPYAPLRQKAYPAFGEQLDALLKLAVALQAQGIELPEDTVKWINNCIAVKEKYKKPSSE